MALLGFLFKDSNNQKRVVFVELKKLKNDVIIGFENFLRTQDLTSAQLLNQALELKSHITLRSALLYTKISLNHTKIVDFRDLTCWLPAKNYKELWTLLHSERRLNEGQIITRINKALTCLFKS